MNSKLTLPNKIAILGATSQIAKDLIVSFSTRQNNKLHLFARRPDDVTKWLNNVGLSDRYLIDDFSVFGIQEFDAIINFVGVGNPSHTAVMGASIFDITLQYDELALNYLHQHSKCRYIFLSSGAAYGSSFDNPVDIETKATININSLQPQDWYAVAKLHAETRHRSLPHLPIVDIRVFNYFSSTQDMNARFLIADIMRAIRDKTVLKTTAEYIVRDYIGPADFQQLVSLILKSPPMNGAIDCYTKAPIDKPTLLASMQEEFGLRHELMETDITINATGKKPHYYSLSRRAEDFGYQPEFTSLENIIIQCEKLLIKNELRN